MVITRHSLNVLFDEILSQSGEQGFNKARNITDNLFGAQLQTATENLYWSKVTSGERIFVTSVLERCTQRGEDILILQHGSDRQELYDIFRKNCNLSTWIG